MIATTAPTALPKATFRDTLGVIAGVILPTVAKGVIIRRPWVVGLAERLDLDRRAVRRLQRLRETYGPGPLLLRVPLQPQALVLSPDDVRRVLDGAPEPFATATSLKRAALAHFEPEMSLISHGPERADRRRFNEAVLDADRPVHRLAEHFDAVVREEAATMLGVARRRHELTWTIFATTWNRVVRRVVLGDAAASDRELTDLLARLRSDANWAFLRPRRTTLRERFHQRLAGYLARAEPNSLAGVIATTPTTPVTAPAGQVPQWLFAFDPAGMATFRALALIAAHPTRTRPELRDAQESPRHERAFLRACLLEALRLWPTTPAILRQTTTETTWETGLMPTRTQLLIFTPYFHRDDERLSFADHFTPELWLDEATEDRWALVPFSAGPAICPGRHLVLLVTSAMLAAILANSSPRLKPPTRLRADRPLPGTLNNYALRFTLDPNPR